MIKYDNLVALFAWIVSNGSTTHRDINFTGSKTTVTTTGDYPVVGVSFLLTLRLESDTHLISFSSFQGVDCGNCQGTWDWDELDATGGEDSDIVLAGGATVCSFLVFRLFPLV